ncbi:hypothetical protein F5Y04DRAFT_100209 [Hypomontagnella monticulosa]|nr:hypothetical protein F5Y04DRAFT_100209 [Hypomontagnella monticulosa]
MSQQYTSSSPTMNQRRSSIASEKTLVDASTRKLNATEKEKELYDDGASTKSRASSSSIPSMMSKAAKKVKAKLGEKSSSSKPKPKSKQQQPDSYPDTLYMWRALAETKI